MKKLDSSEMSLYKLLSCDSIHSKVIMLILLSVCSCAAAFAITYICYLVLGSTSMGTWYNEYWIGFFFICGLLLSAFFVFRKTIRDQPEYVFLIIVLSITCFSSISFSVNIVSWDVGEHFKYVLAYSEIVRPVVLSQAEADMAFLSESIPVFNLNELNLMSEKLDFNDTHVDEYGRTAGGSWLRFYQRVASLPGSLIYAICTALGVPFTVKYILTRLIYSVIYSVVVFLGMKQLKSGKMLYAAVALLPTAVFIASNYSYDYWVNSFVLLACACLVRELQTPDEKMTFKRVLVLFGTFFVAFLPKAVYFPMILLCLLIPKKKFSSSRLSKLFRVGVFVTSFSVALSFVAPFLLTVTPTSGDPRGGSDVNVTEQIAFILSNPFEYAQILFNHFVTDYYSILRAPDYLSFYAYLGFIDGYWWIIIVGVLIFTAITDKSDADKDVGTWKSRTLVIVLHIAASVLVATALYLDFTPVGYESVRGLQHRYLIPLLFCTLVFLSSPRLALPRNNNWQKTLYNSLVLGFMTFVNMYGLWNVYIGLLH